jgi:hypothetical protein
MNPVDMQNMVLKHEQEIADITETQASIVENLATKDELMDAKNELKKEIANCATKDELHEEVSKLENRIESLEIETRGGFAHVNTKLDKFQSETKEILSAILEKIEK